MNRQCAAAICAILIITFTALSWRGIRDKSATMDEPMQGVAAFAFVRERAPLDLDTPALWKYWAMIAEPADALDLRVGSGPWELAQDTRNTWQYTRTIYLNAGAQRADAFLARARVAMLVFGIAVCVAVITWTWQLANPLAAVIAAALICLDPNLIANSPLIKSDVVLALSFVLAGYAAWRCGRNATLATVAAMGLLAATGPAVKVSGILLPPLICLLLFVRAMLPETWWVLRRELRTRRSRLLAAAALCLWCFIAFLLVTWAAYRFDSGQFPPAIASNDLIGKLALWAASHGIVPRTWAAGIAIQRNYASGWPAFFLGMRSDRGWLSYFPLAWLFKTPLATIAAVFLASMFAIRKRPELLRRKWDIAALAIPAGVYAACAIATRFNAGLRHFLVVYPFLYAATATLLAATLKDLKYRPILAGLGALLAIETLAATPNFIAFFNLPSRMYGPLKLLSDANLDWGQDLKLLTQWQHDHEDTPLYVAYFGVSPTGFYGMHCIPMPGAPFFPEAGEQWPSGSCVLAVSATVLQRVYPNWPGDEFYTELRQREPIGTIGGSIYLYRYPQ